MAVNGYVLLQSLAAHSRDTACSEGAGGPPPFIPFAQRGKVEIASKRGLYVSCPSNQLYFVFLPPPVKCYILNTIFMANSFSELVGSCCESVSQ